MFDASEIQNAHFASISDSERLSLLNAQIAYAAAHSPYYREALAGFWPLPSLSALSRLPFLTPEALRLQGRRLVCVSASEIGRVVSLRTSGSTGDAKRLYFTRGDLERTVAFFAEGMAWMTAPGDRVAVLMPCGAPDGIGDLLCRALRRLGAEPLPIGMREDLSAVGRELLAAQPAVLVGFPWQVRLLALLTPALRPRAALLSADYIPTTLSALLRRQWGCAAPAHFGMTETGYGCAVEHPCRPGMVLRADELIAEIADPVHGDPLPPGETGELVLTTLRREAMPLLRYRTGDLAAMDAAGRITRILGRKDIPAEFYALQDRLCALPWLYDYTLRNGRLTALVSVEAPPDSPELLSAAAADAEVDLHPVPSSAAALLQIGKRAECFGLPR